EFQEELNLKPVFDALAKLGLKPEMRKDEEHSSYDVVFHDSTNAERSIGVARTVARYNQPPFVAVKDTRRETQPNWSELLEYVKNEGKKDASVQRYKGLGEMNSEQL